MSNKPILKTKKIQDLIKRKNKTYKYFNEEDSLKAVEQNGYALKYVAIQTENICLKAVEQNGYALKFVAIQTENICLKAVEKNDYALQFVKESQFMTEKELTVAEISELLGFTVKIIKS